MTDLATRVRAGGLIPTDGPTPEKEPLDVVHARAFRHSTPSTVSPTPSPTQHGTVTRGQYTRTISELNKSESGVR